MKFYGNIGFWIGDEETIPGITRPIIKEKKYFGDLQEYSRRWQSSDSINDELKINTNFVRLFYSKTFNLHKVCNNKWE